MKKNINITKDLFVDTVLINDDVILQKIKNINNNFKLSVILSSYRKDSNLINIIDLLLSQSYKNFEIIIVDDTPENNIENVFEKYNEYQNINYIKKQLGSKSAAKNIALDNSRGDYILFLEEDVISIEYNYLETMLKEILMKESDILLLSNAKNIEFFNKVFSKYEKVTGVEFLKNEISHFKNNIDTSLASFIINKDFLNRYNLKFNTELLELENLYFKIQLMDKSQKVSFSCNSSYIKKYSRQSKNSKTLEKTNINRIINALNHLENFSKNKSYRYEMKLLIFYLYIDILKLSNDKNLEKELLRYIKEKRKNVKLDNVLHNILFHISPKLFISLFIKRGYKI